MKARTLRALSNVTYVILGASLTIYLLHLCYGQWAWAGAWFIACMTNCNSLRMLEQRYQQQRALEEVDRLKRECLAFMMQLRGDIIVTCEVRVPSMTELFSMYAEEHGITLPEELRR